MHDKILVPLDGSAVAESILPRVEELAKRFGSEVIVLRAAWVRALPGLDLAEAQIRAVQEAEEYVAAVATRLQQQGITVETCVWYADPVSAILEHAAWHGVDIIAMSTRGRSGLGRLIVGSVATKVLQATNVPILLHRPFLDDEGPALAKRDCRRILLPLDGSEFAETVLPETIALARAAGAEIILLRVMPRPMGDGVEIPSSAADYGEKVVNYLDLVQQHIVEQGVAARWIVAAGIPAEQIVVAADEQQADLIAMATHARSTVGRLIRGSVADAVVRGSGVPVFLTRSTTASVEDIVLNR